MPGEALNSPFTCFFGPSACALKPWHSRRNLPTRPAGPAHPVPGAARGGQRGHERHTRALVPPERLTAVDEEPGGLRSLLTLFERGATRLPTPD